MATASAAARHIDLGERRFRQLLDAGVIEKQNRGEYDLDQVRVAYIRHLRSMAAGRASDTDELTSAKLRRAQADAESAELELNERRSEVIRVDEVEKAWNKIGSNIRMKLLALPARLAPVLVGKKAKQIEATTRSEVDDILESISGSREPKSGRSRK